MSNPFYSPKQLAINTSRQNDTQNEITDKNNRPEVYSKLRIGTNFQQNRLPDATYYTMYGHRVKLPDEPVVKIKPDPVNRVYPISYLLNATSEKLVDVCGSLYRNKDLVKQPYRL